MNYILQEQGIEDVGPTAQEILIYARMFNLLTKDIYVNLTAVVLSSQEMDCSHIYMNII